MSTKQLQKAFTILIHIPVSPATCKTAELHKRLEADAELKLSRRTLERYLEELENNTLVCRREGNKPYYWYRPAGKYLFGEQLNVELALAYVLAEAPLQQNAPETLLNQYRNRIEQAHSKLAQDKLGDWQKRIIQVPGSFPPLALAVEQQIKNTLYQALFEQSCIMTEYQAAGAAVKNMLLHPYGLVNAGERKYLVATDTPDNLASVRLFALQRFKSAALHWQQLVTPQGLDLKLFSTQGLSGWRIQSEPVQIRLQARGLALQQLQDSSLQLEQQQLSDGIYQLGFVTSLTYELVRWCIAMGNDLYIQGPEALLTEINALRKDPLLPL